jgi:hypothetical protein
MGDMINRGQLPDILASLKLARSSRPGVIRHAACVARN